MCAGVAPCGGVSVLKPLAGSRYIYVLILLYLCPHTAIFVSSYCYICVLILLYVCPHTTIYSYTNYYMCVLYAICIHVLVYTCSSRWLPAERLPAALTYASAYVSIRNHTSAYARWVVVSDKAAYMASAYPHTTYLAGAALLQDTRDTTI